MCAGVTCGRANLALEEEDVEASLPAPLPVGETSFFVRRCVALVVTTAVISCIRGASTSYSPRARDAGAAPEGGCPTTICWKAWVRVLEYVEIIQVLFHAHEPSELVRGTFVFLFDFLVFFLLSFQTASALPECYFLKQLVIF